MRGGPGPNATGRRRSGPQDSRTRFLGLLESDPSVSIEDDDGNKMGGAPCAGQYGWVFAQDEFGGAHELGHMYGRQHVAGCQLFEGSAVDDRYPHALGLIGGDMFGDTQGLDAGDTALGDDMRLLDWRTGTADVMTYCGDKWLSDYNYGNILGKLCEEDAADCPDGPTLTGHSRLRSCSAVCRPRKRPSGGRGCRSPARSRRGSGLHGSLAVLDGLKPYARPKGREARSSSAAPADECSRAMR